ncbi:MAG TPA: DUF4126 domain-containing protein [Rubrivivax sp.]|nr:DUF4126 domain-containing protein [Rubrivivax sp.]
MLKLDLAQLAAIAAAMGWASGMRLYAVVFLTGAAGYLGWIPLPAGLQLLQHPVVLGASFLLFVIEFVADKVPGVDTLWDAVHTFIRVPAGAALAAGVFSGFGGADASGAWSLVAALIGGTLAATAHTAKSTTRAAANTSPEPFSNIGLSLLGDAAAPAMLWLAWEHAAWFWPVLAVAVLLALVLIVVLFRFLRGLWRRFTGGPSAMRGAAAG